VYGCAVQDKPLLYGVDVGSSKMFKSPRVRAAAAFAAAAHAGQVRRKQHDTCVLGSVAHSRRRVSINPAWQWHGWHRQFDAHQTSSVQKQTVVVVVCSENWLSACVA
jgi:hypothetical protein